MKNKPYISVIVPAFNEEKLIGRCLDSLKKQTYPSEKYEVIVVDNDSSDNTATIARRSGFKVVKYSTLHRVSAVRNFGATQTNGDILVFMDSDSYAPSRWLETIDKVMDDKGLVAVTGALLPDKRSILMNIAFTIYDLSLRFNNLFANVIGTGCNLVIRKSVFEAIEGFDTSLAASDDADIVLRLQKKFGRNKVAYLAKIQVYASTRKQDSLRVFLPYFWSNAGVYFSIIFLRRVKKIDLVNVR